MTNQSPRMLTTLLLSLALLASACGGGESTITETADSSTSTPATSAPAVEPTAPPAPTPSDEPVPEPTEPPEPTATTAPEPTATTEPTPVPEPTAGPFDDLPQGDPLTFLPSVAGDLTTIESAADLWAQAWRSDADPSQIANALVGYPFDLPAPVEGQIFELLGETDFDEDDGIWETRWRYGLEAAEFPELMADEEDDPIGPAVDVIYNDSVPRFLASGLVLQNTANTSSDAHPSGVGSFQIYFRPDADFPISAGGNDGELDVMAVLMQVDLDYGDVEGETPQPGYTVGGSGNFDAAPAGLPLVGAIDALLNVPDSMTLTRGRIVTSFAEPVNEGDANGTPVIDVSIEYQGRSSEFDGVVAALGEATAEPGALAYGHVVDGVLQPDIFEVGLSTASADLLLVGRHAGRMSAWVPDADEETFELNVSFTLSADDVAIAG